MDYYIIIFLILLLYIKFLLVKFSFDTYFKIFKMSFFNMGMPGISGGNI